MNWTRTHALVSGLGLIVLVNAIALTGVAWNRSEPADSRLHLSERELDNSYSFWRKENNSVALRLDYRWPRREADDNRSPPLNAEKMAELGFSVPSELNEDSVQRYRRQLDRDALLVLELDGPSSQRELLLAREQYDSAQQLHALAPKNKNLKNEAERARETLEQEQHRASRLFVIDAGLDQHRLRTRYPDRQRYAIVRGKVRVAANSELLAWSGEGPDPRPQEKRWVWQIGGYAEIPVAQSLNLPKRWHAIFDSLPLRKAQPDFPYASKDKVFNAEVAFGRRLEPWIMQLQAGQP
ncbi:DUF4824 family protein [Pseudomonas sp.]|uniref:DUF4824 family protein n=1 Tax=Pseudomonas sp. TaxID=306 RepID=UPI002732BE80|nr:DUF4824 family protein [Pseudomonas sp.]MDP3815861.1 DUF4824 family protein [Pseudomonas sp.]